MLFMAISPKTKTKQNKTKVEKKKERGLQGIKPLYEILCELAGIAAWTRASKGIISFIFSLSKVTINAYVH